MSSKLFKVFILLLFFCTSVLSSGIELEQYPKTAKGDDKRTWIGSQKYNLKPERDGLIAEANGTFKLLKEKKDKEGGMPAVVSALTTGDGHTHFASSAKGDGNMFSHPDVEIHQDIKDALAKCGKEHRTGGNCAEIMAVASWYRSNPGKKLSDEHSKLIVAVNKKGVVDPCTFREGDKGDHGCKDFLDKMGFKEHEIIRNPPKQPEEHCDVVKRSIGGKTYNKKACAMKSGAKSGKQPPKKAMATPQKQPNKVTATPRKKAQSGVKFAPPREQPHQKTTAAPQKQPPKKATAAPQKQATAPPRKQVQSGAKSATLRKQATATPRKQAPKKPSTARKHRRSMRSLVRLKGGVLRSYSST